MDDLSSLARGGPNHAVNDGKIQLTPKYLPNMDVNSPVQDNIIPCRRVQLV